ncbi:glycosyltransferase family 4 protein [Mariniradius sediminis]|uniref:Glycosyltransferase family 4 protein n=1 Tax=Mariniradius sediminis TaxID=2909237 RepID=A0ABS9BU86_9BACT|nr:glycosyltransferase family 4 protein [Mariniradius sediminis]MCF1751622.1 glycosyltransferase family 4 protein [Mariniradius sediminis]
MNRYVFICGNLYPHQIGGLEVFNHHLIKELGKITEVSVVSHQERPNEILKRDFIGIKTLPPHGLFFSFGIFFRMLFAKLDDIRVVVSFSKAHWINWLPYIALKKLRNLKYVVVIHSGDLGEWRNTPIHLALFRNAHALFGVSESICNAYGKSVNQPVNYLPPLIPFERENLEKSACRHTLGIPQDRKVILAVGSMRQVKRPNLPLAALDLLGYQFLKKERILLVFVGDGELRNELETSVKKLGIEEFVRFDGIQLREKIPFYLKAGDVYLISSEYEGQPLSLLEALSYPIEIVGSDADGVRSILDAFGGNVFERGNTEALANLLKKVLTDPTYEPKYARSNLYFHERFDYQKVLHSFVEKTR